MSDLTKLSPIQLADTMKDLNELIKREIKLQSVARDAPLAPEHLPAPSGLLLRQREEVSREFVSRFDLPALHKFREQAHQHKRDLDIAIFGEATENAMNDLSAPIQPEHICALLVINQDLQHINQEIERRTEDLPAPKRSKRASRRAFSAHNKHKDNC